MLNLFRDNTDLGWALVADLVTHDFDVRHSLGLRDQRASATVTVSAERYARRLIERASEAELPSLAVIVGGERLGPSGAITELAGSAFEILRATTGRRSEAQIRAMDWTSNADLYLAVISAYGPPPAEDLIE